MRDLTGRDVRKRMQLQLREIVQNLLTKLYIDIILRWIVWIFLEKNTEKYTSFVGVEHLHIVGHSPGRPKQLEELIFETLRDHILPSRGILA